MPDPTLKLMDPTPDDLADTLAKFRDAEFARWFLFAFALAAHQYPEEIRKAIGTVFSTEGLEESQRRLALVLAENQSKLAEAQQAVGQLKADLDRIKDDARVDLEEMRARLHKMHAWLTAKAKQLQKVTK